MARGDVKYARPRGSGGGRSSSSVYNDEGRGHSKTLWEWFERNFNVQTDARGWLLATIEQPLSDDRLYQCVTYMRDRYGVHDWAWRKYEDSEGNDGRVRRLVVSVCGVDVWKKLQERAKKVKEEVEERKRKERHERSEQWSQQMADFKAEQIKRQEEENRLIYRQVDLISGSLRSDFNTAFELHNVHGLREGDWLDSPTDAYVSGYGFGSEESKPTGIKLQVTLSIDLSNSMIHNGLGGSAPLFRDIYLAMDMLRQEHPNDLFIAAFEFCKYDGRRADCLTHALYSGKELIPQDANLPGVESYRNEVSKWHFSGEDTWFYPLFEAIEAWENKCSDPGAFKLDLIITDAVIEHPSDIRRSDEIQERRDGSLQTVMLNLLPMEEWVNSDLPLRCVQYPANMENIAGLLRNVISEFVNMFI